jgi:hypothetical protein
VKGEEGKQAGSRGSGFARATPGQGRGENKGEEGMMGRIEAVRELSDEDLSQAIDQVKWKRGEYQVVLGRWRKDRRMAPVSGALPADAVLVPRSLLLAEQKRRKGLK